MTRAAMTLGSVLALSVWLAPAVAEAQRMYGETTDYTSLGVVLGVLVLGVVAFVLARGRR